VLGMTTLISLKHNNNGFELSSIDFGQACKPAQEARLMRRASDLGLGQNAKYENILFHAPASCSDSVLRLF